jgi:hypothetical protein
MRLCVVCLAVMLPGAAFANCSSAEMKMCQITPLGTASIYEEPCAYTQCATADSVFEYLLFGDGSHARVDYTGDGTGLLEARFGFMDKQKDKIEYSAMPVTVFFDVDSQLSIGSGDEGFIATRPCGDTCVGINADEFGR